MVNSVSFRANDAGVFCDLVNRQQAYTKTNPSAATGVSGDSFEGGKKKKHPVLILGLLAVGAAALLAIGHKNNLFIKNLGEKGKVLDNAGKTISDKFSNFVTLARSKFEKVTPGEVIEAGEDLATKA